MPSAQPRLQSQQSACLRSLLRIIPLGASVGAIALAVSLSVPAAHAAPHASPKPTVIATPVPSPGPSGTSTSHSSGGPLSFLNPSSWIPDPKQWAADVFSQVLVTFLQSMASGLRSLVNGVMGSNLNFITRTPPAGTYDSPTVHTLWNVVRGIADAALVVVSIIAGFNVMARQHFGSPYHEAMEVVPRLIVGTLLVNASMFWGQLAIDLNNAFCSARAHGLASLAAGRLYHAGARQRYRHRHRCHLDLHR